jgi:hypothetical protein
MKGTLKPDPERPVDSPAALRERIREARAKLAEIETIHEGTLARSKIEQQEISRLTRVLERSAYALSQMGGKQT